MQALGRQAANGLLGLALGVVAMRLRRGLLFKIDALDALMLLGVPLVLGVAALLAAYLPAGPPRQPGQPRRCAPD